MRRSIHTILWGTCVLLLLTAACGGPEQEPPRVSVPGYKADLTYDERFETDISDWPVEGDGRAALTEAGELQLLAGREGDGLMLWAPIELSGSFQLEFEVDISDSCGTFRIFFCVQESNDGDPLESMESRFGRLNDFTRGALRNYMITCNTMNEEGAPQNRSRLRKNPQYLLLSHADSDPCLQGKRHLIDLVKISNRIQFYIDGGLIHDVRDKGGFDAPVYMTGRLGFHIQPLDRDASLLLHRVKLYQLNPI